MGNITINFVDGTNEVEMMSDDESKEMEGQYRMVVGAITESKGKFVESIVYEMIGYKMTIEKMEKKDAS